MNVTQSNNTIHLSNIYNNVSKHELTALHSWNLIDNLAVVEILEGSVDLFVYDLSSGTHASKKNYITTLNAGSWIFPVPSNNVANYAMPSDKKFFQYGIQAVPRKGTIIEQISLDNFLNTAPNTTNLIPLLKIKFEHWINALDGALQMHEEDLSSHNVIQLQQSGAGNLPAGSIISAHKDVFWTYVAPGHLHHFTRVDAELQSTGKFTPPATSSSSNLNTDTQKRILHISKNSYLICYNNTDIQVAPTEVVLQELGFYEMLVGFCCDLIVSLHDFWQYRFILQKNRIDNFQKINDSMIVDAIEELANTIVPIEKQEDKDNSDPIFKAIKYIGKEQNIEFKSPPSFALKENNHQHYINQIAEYSNVRIRNVTLEKGWWLYNGGYILGFKKDEEKLTPVVFIPKIFQGYYVLDITTGEKSTLDKSNYLNYSTEAYTFYPPFPNTTLTGKDVFWIAFNELKHGVGIIAFCMVVLGIMSWISPIVQQNIFGEIIPNGELADLIPIITFMIGMSFASLFISIAQSIAMISLKGWADSRLEAALFDRVLSLPSKFFRHFSSGDLTERVGSFNQLREIMTGTVISTMLSSFSSLFSFVILFKFDARLSVIAIITSLITAGLMVANSLIQLKFQYTAQDLSRKVMSVLFQIFGGVGKIQTTGTENRAIKLWADYYSKQNDIANSAQSTSIYFSAIGSSWSFIINLIIYIFVIRTMQSSSPINTGEFIAFTSAFGAASGALNNLSGLITTYVSAIPIYKQALPLFEATPETHRNAIMPGVLKGQISIKNVKFRYEDNLPLVLHGVSLDVEPGQFVAICGSSGAGKSSLIRLLLGLDTPEEGSIYYDGKELTQLDVRAVRRQIGVVVQNAKINPGDIYGNIVGSLPYSMDEAWEAVRMAGLEEDIKRMPMGLHTYVSEGGGSLSGGQIQRLIIARALIRKPKIIIFDEATSALDNNTQAIVSRSIEQLKATRIVIAHRLSTIINADKIVVMDKGKIVQEGTYQELFSQPGIFQELARRQIA